MREFSDCSTRIAAAESPVIALAKSRVMPENIYYTARWLRIKTADRRTIATVYYINYSAWDYYSREIIGAQDGC